MSYFVDEESDDEENDWEKEEPDDDVEFDKDDELISEMSEERGGYVYLRHRDKKGRFASEFKDPDHELDLEMDRKIRRFEREYRKKIELPYYVKILLLRLVDDFRNRDQFCENNGFYKFYIPSVYHFKRLPYHEVLKSCKMKRSAFSLFIDRMVTRGLVRKKKHGRKLYLKITKLGLDKVYAFWEEYPGETWRFP